MNKKFEDWKIIVKVDYESISKFRDAINRMENKASNKISLCNHLISAKIIDEEGKLTDLMFFTTVDEQGVYVVRMNIEALEALEDFLFYRD